MRHRFIPAVFILLIFASLGAGPSIFDEPPANAGSGSKPAPASRPGLDVGDDITSQSGSSLDATVTAIRSANANEIAHLNTPATAAPLLKKLLTASDTSKDAGRQLALLQVAREVAGRVGDLQSVGDAISRTDLTLHRLSASNGSAGSTPKSAELAEMAHTNAVTGWRVADWASLQNQFGLALSAAGTARKSAKLTGDAHLVAKADAILARLTEFGAASDAAAGAQASVVKNPIDAAAYLVLGRFECFYRGNWESGLPKLAGSSDPVLKPLAIADLSHPFNLEEQVALADGWSRAAEKLTRLQQPTVYAHAVRWYEIAMARITGLERQRVLKRLGELYPLSVSLPLDPDDGTEILQQMIGVPVDAASGTAFIPTGSRLISNRSFRPPVRFRIIAMTNRYNIRVGYAADQIIFNWELNLDDLRIDGGPANGHHAPGMGRVPVNEWVTIDVNVLPGSMSLYVDGRQRYDTTADFSGVDEPLRLFTNTGSMLRVKSVRVISD